LSLPTLHEQFTLLCERFEPIVLGDLERGPCLLLSAQLQGRVMSSSATGRLGPGNGWIHAEAIRAGAVSRQFNPFGGEERFWLGPEGGPLGLFFAPGVPMEYPHWRVPPAIDHEPFEVVWRDQTAVSFTRRIELRNRAGTTLAMRVDRRIRVLAAAEIGAILRSEPRGSGPFAPGAARGGVEVVGYESQNEITNVGSSAWGARGGAPSIWLLGMFPAGPRAGVICPYRAGVRRAGESPCRSDYFGALGPDRLHTTEQCVIFRADGQYRSKIGLNARFASEMNASWDPDAGRLTIVRFDPPSPRGCEGMPYVDSRWCEQEDPFAGDVVNAYNDGPGPTGARLGAFHEIETSSPALFLAPGATGAHRQCTVHLRGSPEMLDPIARRVLGFPLT